MTAASSGDEIGSGPSAKKTNNESTYSLVEAAQYGLLQRWAWQISPFSLLCILVQLYGMCYVYVAGDNSMAFSI